MSPEKRMALVEFIKTAFKDAPYPADGYIGYELGDFKGYTHETLPLEVIRLHRDEIFSFSPAGLRYFMSDLLTAVILYPEEVDTLTDNLLSLLTPPDETRSVVQREVFAAHPTTFERQEKCAIYRFLDAYHELAPGELWTTEFSYEFTLELGIEVWKHQCEG